jgi:hypothetical protein
MKPLLSIPKEEEEEEEDPNMYQITLFFPPGPYFDYMA